MRALLPALALVAACGTADRPATAVERDEALGDLRLALSVHEVFDGAPLLLPLGAGSLDASCFFDADLPDGTARRIVDCSRGGTTWKGTIVWDAYGVPELTVDLHATGTTTMDYGAQLDGAYGHVTGTLAIRTQSPQGELRLDVALDTELDQGACPIGGSLDVTRELVNARGLSPSTLDVTFDGCGTMNVAP